ncbi:hypothetical protein [Inquilinus sp.]|uniref:hypothetical protein n=1 Tax=Inquilinus sp. TaxID=1932117 RepID=UPI0031DC2541
MRSVVLAFVALLVVAACQTLSPGITVTALAERGAKLVPGTRLTSIFADQTVYVRFTRNFVTMKAGEEWVEYYRPDGVYYYKDRVDSFEGKWTIEGNDFCFAEDVKKYCAAVYEENGAYYFVYLSPGTYQNQVIGRTIRFAKGNVESLRNPFSFQ